MNDLFHPAAAGAAGDELKRLGNGHRVAVEVRFAWQRGSGIDGPDREQLLLGGSPKRLYL